MLRLDKISWKSFFLLLVLLTFQSNGQQKKWLQITSPTYADFKNIQFIHPDTAFIGQKNLLIYCNQHWQLFDKQPPCDINLVFAISSNSIYITSNNDYQSSDLYYWNGQNWKKIIHPVANTISDIYFSDKNNGYLLSFGEIAQLKDGQWKHLSPPTNQNLSTYAKNTQREYVLSKGIGVFQLNTQWKKINKSNNTLFLKNINETIYTVSHNSLGYIDADSIKTINTNTVWKSINSITKNSNGHIIGVGNNGLIIDYYHQIDTIKSVTTSNLNKITTSNNELWSVGNEGTIICYSDKKFSKHKNEWKGFEKVTFKQGVKLIDDEYGVVAADFNNDGLPDIFTCGLFEENHLYINKNNLEFVDEASAYGISKLSKKGGLLNLGACTGDIDNDGYIDLYISVLNGRNIIFKNINGEKFINYSSISKGIGTATDRTNAVIMGDVDNDGDLDIFITNEFSTNRIYLNNGVGIFTEITQKAGLVTKEGGNSASFSDIDNDGDIDLLVTTWSSQNILYKNLWKETGNIHFENITNTAKIGGNGYDKSNAIIFFDYNNDNYPDVFISNRKTSNRIYINNKDNTFTDKTTELLGQDNDESYGAVIADFDGDMHYDIYVSNIGINSFFRYDSGKFEAQNQKYETDIKGYSTGTSIADFDNDGDIDIYVSNYLGESSTLLKNMKQNNNYVKLMLTGYHNNRNAIGSKIKAYSIPENKLIFSDELNAGGGYVSMNSFTKIIPILAHDSIRVIITFPNGINREIIAKNKQSYLIEDASGWSKYALIASQNIKRQIFDTHRLFELIKWLFVLFFIFFFVKKSHKKFSWSNIFSISLWIGLVLLYYLQFQQFEYEHFIFATLLPLTSIVLISLYIYSYNDKNLVKIKANIEKDKIKLQLSQNLHDDLAATISSIGFYLTLIKFSLKEKNKEVSEFLQKSESLLKDATESITDMIWSFNAQPDSLENILLRLQNNFITLFKQFDIQFNIDWQTKKMHQKLAHNTKQNIYLILKEILNNILKYAKATEVHISINKNNKNIVITVVDNGKGFNLSEAINKGNGLKNIQNRAIDFNGDIQINSIPDKGTTITITIPHQSIKKMT